MHSFLLIKRAPRAGTTLVLSNGESPALSKHRALPRSNAPLMFVEWMKACMFKTFQWLSIDFSFQIKTKYLNSWIPSWFCHPFLQPFCVYSSLQVSYNLFSSLKRSQCLTFLYLRTCYSSSVLVVNWFIKTHIISQLLWKSSSLSFFLSFFFFFCYAHGMQKFSGQHQTYTTPVTTPSL